MPPSKDTTTVSTTNCDISRPRPAPIANRTAISFCRPADRASNRFATFAHAINSTIPTTIISTVSGLENCTRK